MHLIFYFRVATPLSRKPLLTNAPYPYYDWFTSSNKEKDLYLSCNLREGSKNKKAIYSVLDKITQQLKLYAITNCLLEAIVCEGINQPCSTF